MKWGGSGWEGRWKSREKGSFNQNIFVRKNVVAKKEKIKEK